MSSAGKQSIQMIQGQIDAFKGLQTQATIGSNVYRQLAGDVNRLSDTLRRLRGDYEEVGRVARQTDAQIANQFPAARPAAFRTQLAALNRQLEQISVSARAYGDALTEITKRELAFGRAQARQQVIAGAQAVGDPLIGRMTPRQELPNTLAALQLRISELTQDFDNLDRAGEQYVPTLAEINRLQRELTRATEDGSADRKTEIRQRIENYRAIQAENAAVRERAQIRRSIARGQAGTGQGALQGPAAPARRTSALFQSIADIGLGGVARDVEMMGRSYADVEGVIRRVSAASDGSIASLQKQRNVWQQLFVQLEPGTAIFKRVEQDIQRLDRRLEKFQSRRRGLGAMGATQAAGAVISGGIFGGPEGAIGGIAGTIAAGVPGAFAGAAAGAQIGIMRQQLGAMAQFTAEIDKQRIALRSVVGSQQDYQQALQFIDATSRRAAIPHDQLTTQFTQLAASVIGAGGSVDIAERAFRGMAAGIRGTGGSLEAMKAAMLATSQVFSKGKVSAEEIRQQIGERLPGAFTTFATAIGKTPAMLDKMLQKGEVTLDDFMLLIEELIRTYEPSMDRIAASSQAAGDRMQVTFARIREAVGRELQPVGAQFQEIFANFFEENEQAIVNFASSIAALARAIADNAGTIAESLKILIGLAGIAGTAFAVTKVAAGVTFVTAAIAQMGGVASAASLAVTTLKAALIAIPGVNVVAGAVAGLALLGKAVYDTNEVFRNFVDNIGGVLAEDFRNSVDGMAKDADLAANNIKNSYAGLTSELNPIAEFIKQLFRDAFQSTSDSAQTSAVQSSNAFSDFFDSLASNASAGFTGLTQIINNWWAQLPGPIRSVFEGNALSLLTGAAQYAGGAAKRAAQGKPEPYVSRFAGARDEAFRKARMITGRSTFFGGGGDVSGAGGGGGKSDANRAAEAAAKEAERVDEVVRSRTAESIIIRLNSDLKDKISAAELAQDSMLVARLQGMEKELSIQYQYAKELAKEKDVRAQAAIILEGQTALVENHASTQRELNRIEAARTKAFDEIIADLDFELRLKQATTEEAREQLRLEMELRKLKDQGFTPEQISAITGRKQALSAPETATQTIQKEIGRLKDELADLTNIGNQVVGAATAIGDAFGNSFKGVITGSMTAKEALAGFFSSVADYFADMAAKMIAQWIKLAILNTVLKLFPGGSLLTAASPEVGAIGQGSSIFAAANGGAFAQNGIVPYAKGGIVNSPTLFKFAKGGSMATGVMGEAGPEAIMPLKRGPDGKLGVQATGGGGIMVNVNVDAKGTSVEGDQGQGQQLGRIIAIAVQSELIKQQRPGGVLNKR
jgi:tape measure domain-containing protein